MDKEKFFNFCLDQYNRELEYADNPFPRAQFLWGGQTFLLGFLFTITPKNILREAFATLPNLLFTSSFIISVLSLIAGIAYVVLSLFPRKRYESIALTENIRNWRIDYFEQLEKSDPEDVSGNITTMENATIDMLTKELTETQLINRHENEMRMVQFKKAFTFFSIGLGAAAFQGILYLFVV